MPRQAPYGEISFCPFAYVMPDGYEAMNLPQTAPLKTSFADFLREYSANGSKINGCELLSLKIAHPPSEEYETAPNFFKDISGVSRLPGCCPERPFSYCY